MVSAGTPRPYWLGLGCFENEKKISFSRNSRFLTNKNEEVSCTDTSPSLVSGVWLGAVHSVSKAFPRSIVIEYLSDNMGLQTQNG